MLYNIGERPHWNKEGAESSSIHTHSQILKGSAACTRRGTKTKDGVRSPWTVGVRASAGQIGSQ
jgi:hypothetical protein